VIGLATKKKLGSYIVIDQNARTEAHCAFVASRFAVRAPALSVGTLNCGAKLHTREPLPSRRQQAVEEQADDALDFVPVEIE
jgi:hypothetical protein